jgi:hypothetical protein
VPDVVLRWNTIFVPSGDQAGDSSSNPALVINLCEPPLGAIAAMSFRDVNQAVVPKAIS